ncbi:meprin A subunit beta-like [Dromiciops gliroides]|uniref:meprin A subunit beta-like n=1 Tax=Dromiciops gliroides TaxID=33562 RepID=UPI001CC56F03|nr:meprin A subunit beta-like [Dromiciops gliroides]
MDSWCLPWVLLCEALRVISGLPALENFDVDGGKNNDIFDINHALGLNLFEGDINLGGTARSSLIGDKNKWPHVIPYVLSDNLEINAKGIIMRALERYRLKTCIDFKRWKGEDNYIFFHRGEGCSSLVGNRHIGKQDISIGTGCDRIGAVQHEILHALGFVHEHSRTDRDDYIIIMENNLFPGTENNFYSLSEKIIETLNVPYDYISVMHYPKTAFQIKKEPTIITRNPDFMDIIGQRMDFSDYDIEKLSRRYNCSSSLTFLDSCDFELEDICGMIQSSEDNGDWQRVSQVPGGPDTDQSYQDKCKGSCFFMHFNSSSLKEGEKAILESRIFYPKRTFQCLQFYYYNSGNNDDQLKIYIREYVSSHHEISLTLLDEVKDVPVGSWQPYYVKLAATNKFRVVFEGTRGNGTSVGGLSIDDINLSETWCPHHIWRISNFTQILSSRGVIDSPPYYSHKGYAFQVQLDASDETKIGMYFFLISGANDEQLRWPCVWQQATMTLLDQNPDIRRRMSNERSLTTDPFKTIDNDNEIAFWDKPSKVGMNATFPNGTSYIRGRGYGSSAYITQKWLKSRDFIKGDNVYILLTVEDISHLLFTQPGSIPTKVPVQPTKLHVNLCANFTCENDGICVIRQDKAECRCQSGEGWWYNGEKCEKMGSNMHIIVMTALLATIVFTFMLIVTFLNVCFIKKKYRKRHNANASDITIEKVYDQSLWWLQTTAVLFAQELKPGTLFSRKVPTAHSIPTPHHCTHQLF